MKLNGTRPTAGRGRISLKKLTALILALAMALAMFCAVAEDSDAGLLPAESTQVSGEAILIEDAAAEEDGMGIELADDAVLDDALVVNGLSLDGFEDSLLVNGLSEPEGVAEAPANALAGNDSNPGDFEIEDCELVKYKGAGGDVVIPPEVKSIGNRAFAKSYNLTSVTIPDGVKSIGKEAFYDCVNLTDVTIPDSVTRIGDGAFTGCNKKLTIHGMPGSYAEKYVSEKSAVISIAFDALPTPTPTPTPTSTPDPDFEIDEDGVLVRYVGKGGDVIIPPEVKSIGNRAFANSFNLTSVTIPDGVKSIGKEAFYDCVNLTDVTIPNSVTSIGTGAFTGCNEKLTIYGMTGSYAEQYVAEKSAVTSIAFVALDSPDVTPVPTAKPTTQPTGTTPYAPDPTAKPTETDAPAPTQAPGISLSKCKITVKNQVYTGKKLTPSVTVKYGDKTLAKGTDYTVAYKNNKAIGTAAVTVTGKGDYTGTVKKTFKINPKKVSGLKLTAGNDKLGLSWKKASGGVSGYQLQYSLNKDFSGARKVNVSKASTVKATLEKLKAGKTYYVRIRAFKKVDGKTYWSAWSPARKAKVK